MQAMQEKVEEQVAIKRAMQLAIAIPADSFKSY